MRFPDLSLAVVKLLGPGEYVVEPVGTVGTGHFGLAAPDYTHGTAPNRRYADLVTERLLKAAAEWRGAAILRRRAHSNRGALHHAGGQRAARTRFVHKQAAALLLAPRIGQVFDGVVTGVTESGTFARVFTPPVEGRVMQSAQHLAVGDRVRVRLAATPHAVSSISKRTKRAPRRRALRARERRAQKVGSESVPATPESRRSTDM